MKNPAVGFLGGYNLGMVKVKMKAVLVAAVATLAVAAGAGYWAWLAADLASPSARWYSAAQAQAGEHVFVGNCLACHGEAGQSVANWQQRLPDGSFPPPPLNGSAHTWHHSFAALKRTIQKGGAQYGGKMPAFENTLSDEEIEQVIAYFQSQWSEEIYQVWDKRVNNRN